MNETEKAALPSEERWNKKWQEHWQNHPDSACRERFETAQKFYLAAGMSEQDALNHMKGINFNREVSVVKIKPDEVLRQYQYPSDRDNKKVGSYFTASASKEELGLQGDSSASKSRSVSDDFSKTEERTLEPYVTTKEIQVLKSTTADIEAWNKPSGELYYGGGEQYFITSADKESMMRWDQYLAYKSSEPVRYSDLGYSNGDGSQTLYNCEIYYNQNNQPFAVVLTEAPNSQARINDELISRAAAGVAKETDMQNGSLHVFAEKVNGSFEQVPFEVRTIHRNPEVIPYLEGNSAGYEQKEVSKSELNQFVNSQSQENLSFANNRFSQNLQEYRNEQSQSQR